MSSCNIGFEQEIFGQKLRMESFGKEKTKNYWVLQVTEP